MRFGGLAAEVVNGRLGEESVDLLLGRAAAGAHMNQLLTSLLRLLPRLLPLFLFSSVLGSVVSLANLCRPLDAGGAELC